MDGLYSSENQPDEMEGESGVTRSILDEFHASDIRRDQMEG